MTAMNVKYWPLQVTAAGITYYYCNFQAVDEVNLEQITQYAIQGSPADPTTMPYPTFLNGDDACAYFLVSACTALVAQVNSDSGSTVFTSYNALPVDPETALAIQNSYNSAVALIPTLVSQLINDSGFVTAAGIGAFLLAATAASTYAPLSRQINGHDLSADITLATTDLSDFNTATDGRITTKINALVNGAPGALDTLKELADAINDDASYAATITSSLGNKVDKVTGKGLSTNDYTSAEKTKLAGIAAGATAYTDANALAAALTGLSIASSSAAVATDSVLVAIGKLQAQVTNALNGLNTAISNISPSLVGTGATGTQVSASKRSTIHLGLNESVTSNIGGAATAVINIKICATNNATEASWTNLFTFEEDQTVTLAIALQSIQVMKGAVSFEIPAGYYWKAESSGSGTNSEGILSGQQIIYG